jgi:polar amino acid transport system substrate-binding protein
MTLESNSNASTHQLMLDRVLGWIMTEHQVKNLFKAPVARLWSYLTRYGLLTILSITILVTSLGLSATGVAARAPAPQPAEKLQVVTKPLEPFVIVDEDGSLTGFSIDLWQALATELGIDYEWIQVEQVSEQLQAVQEGPAEVAIAGISMTPEREELVDFMHPYFNAGLRIMASNEVGSAPSALSLVSNIFSPALLQVLGLGFLTLVAMAHIIWLVERGSDEAMPKAYLPGIWEALWWSLLTIAKLKYGDGEKPPSVFRRLLVMFWIVLGIILIAQFTARSRLLLL